MPKKISRSGTGEQRDVSVSRRAVTRIAPDEAQGHAGQTQRSSGDAAAAFRHMVDWSAPGLGDSCCSSGFGEGFKKPGA